MNELKSDEKQLLEQYRAMNVCGKKYFFEMAEFYSVRYPLNVVPLSVLEEARKRKISK